MHAVLLFSFVSAIALSAGLTWSIRDVALRRGWVRSSLSARHLHPISMPRLGGAAIAGAVVAISCVAMFAMRSLLYTSKHSVDQMLLVLSAALVNFGVGLADDIQDLPIWVRVAAEILAGGLLWIGGIRILYFASIFHSHEFGAALSLLLTICWILLISNAFNLIDGLDGLAAGSALFSVLTVFVVSLIDHQVVQSLLAAVLAGAILGFLRYNFNPATIFLGDCGSLFIGTLLAGLTLTGATQQKSSTLFAVAIPLVAFGLPVVETVVSVIRRFLRGQSIFVADRDHIHHRLLNRGWSHRQAVVLLYGVSAVFAILSLALLAPGQAPLAIVLLVLGVGVVVGVDKLKYHEFFEIGRVARRALEQKQIIVNNLAVRRGAEGFSRCTNWVEIFQVLQETFTNNEFDTFMVIVKAEGSGAIAWAHRWQRPLPRLGGELSSTDPWSLSLPLRVSKGKWTGSLELLRFDGSELLLDINLLTSEFRAELETACHRVLSARGDIVPSAEEGARNTASSEGWPKAA